jgi:hypothetical protein
VLVKQWAEVVDHRSVFALILEAVSTAPLDIGTTTALPQKNLTRLSASRFEAVGPGEFLLWVEFSIPRNEGVDVGTAEVRLRPDGSGVVSRVVGRRLSPR